MYILDLRLCSDISQWCNPDTVQLMFEDADDNRQVIMNKLMLTISFFLVGFENVMVFWGTNIQKIIEVLQNWFMTA